MTRDEAVEQIKIVLAFRSGGGLDAKIQLALRNAQVEREKLKTLPWFLQTEVASVSMTADEERVQLPTDFLREVEQNALQLHDDSSDAANTVDEYTELVKDDIEFLRRTLPGDGTPSSYGLDVSYFRLFVTPDTAAVAKYTLKMVYYKKDTVLNSNVENLWLEHHPFILIGVAGTLIATGLRDKEAVAIFAAFEAKHQSIMVGENETRRHSNRRYIMGGPD